MVRVNRAAMPRLVLTSAISEPNNASPLNPDAAGHWANPDGECRLFYDLWANPINSSLQIPSHETLPQRGVRERFPSVHLYHYVASYVATMSDCIM